MTTLILPRPFKLNAKARLADAKPAPALDDLPFVLHGRKRGPRPPILSYGFLADKQKLKDMCAELFDYSPTSYGDAEMYVPDAAIWMTLDHMANTFKHKITFDFILFEGRGQLMIAITNNYRMHRKREEIARKVAEFLQLPADEKPRWFLSEERWWWEGC